jgi:hypothetical protein
MTSSLYLNHKIVKQKSLVIKSTKGPVIFQLAMFKTRVEALRAKFLLLPLQVYPPCALYLDISFHRRSIHFYFCLGTKRLTQHEVIKPKIATQSNPTTYIIQDPPETARGTRGTKKE